MRSWFRRRVQAAVATPAARIALVAIALTLGVQALAFAHAVVYPKASTVGARERYVIRVPNERNLPTTRVEIQFPAEVNVTSFYDVPGWQLEVVRDSAKRIIGAVWTGTLAPQRFVELPFVAANPRADARLVWPVYQTYADGERVAWTGPEDAKTPASTTVIRAPIGNTPSGGMIGAGLWMAIAALALSLVSLGVVLRRPTVDAGAS